MATGLNYSLLPLGYLLQLIAGEITEEQAESIIRQKMFNNKTTS